MDVSALIPSFETIPAPWPVFDVLSILTLTIHFLLMNVVVGSTLLMFFSGLFKSSPVRAGDLTDLLAGKIPSILALAITFGVAPLLFLQVLYGSFIYTSSVLMAVWWILVIPVLILSYYGVYIHARRYASVRWLSVLGLGVASAGMIYVMFVYVNNMTLMAQPQAWTAYFDSRGGTLLNLGNPAFFPRFLHHLTASVAVAGLFAAILVRLRLKRGTGAEPGSGVRGGLRIFALATCLQLGIGIWFLLSLPRPVMLAYMGGNLAYTIVLMAGMAATVGSLITAFAGKLWPTVSFLIPTMLLMVVSRANLRSLYLAPFFKPETLELRPQYPVLALFLVVLVLGLGAVVYMVKTAFPAVEGGER